MAPGLAALKATISLNNLGRINRCATSMRCRIVELALAHFCRAFVIKRRWAIKSFVNGSGRCK